MRAAAPLIACLALLSAPAAGQSSASAGVRIPSATPWTMSLGLAPVVAPIWQGSRDHGLSVFPDLRINYKDSLFFSIPDGLGWNAINEDGWKIGPVAKIRFGRRANTGGSPFLITRGSTALRGMGDVDLAGEFGSFIQKSVMNGKLRVRAELRQGSGGHDGLIADTLIGWSDRRRDAKLLWNIALRATWADSDYTNSYFGVNAAQALATGLATSRTGSGLVSAGLTGNLIKPLGPLGRNGAITAFASYDHLGDSVARSSLIRERGQRGQFAFGLGYSYRFGL